MSPSLAAIRELYGEHHIVSPRRWGGTFSYSASTTPTHSEFEVSREDEDGHKTRAIANAYLGLSAVEPQVTPVTNDGGEPLIIHNYEHPLFGAE